MQDFYELHPDLRDFPNALTYISRDCNNAIIEYWQRENLNSLWVNYTERQRLTERIERQKAEILRLERLKRLQQSEKSQENITFGPAQP